jgi:hypothetical protein
VAAWLPLTNPPLRLKTVHSERNLVERRIFLFGGGFYNRCKDWRVVLKSFWFILMQFAWIYKT